MSFVVRNRPQQIEGGIHALGKGSPLPPPQHGKSLETERDHADTAAARSAGGAQQLAAATAAAPSSAASTSPPYDGGCAREAGRAAGGGRGTDGSGRNGAAVGATGSFAAQVCVCACEQRQQQ